jgi:multiple sugar transport system substrate-binding protein
MDRTTSGDRRPYVATRRTFLRDSLALGGLLAVPSLLAACGGGGDEAGGAAAGQGTTGEGASAGGELTFWEYKYPPDSNGYRFFTESAQRFADKTGITVNVQFQSAEGIEQAVAAAANAKEGFDAMLWWSGPTARNQSSLGNVIPLDDKFPQELWGHKAGLEVQKGDDGKIYGLSFTAGGYFMAYNRQILEQAGVGADAFPPADEDPIGWPEFLDICGRIKTNAGVAPIMFANKEGYFNEWWFYNLQAQAFDTTEQVQAINLGDESYVHPDLVRACEAWKEIYANGYFLEGGEAIPFEQHTRQMASGQAAMTGAYFDVQGATAAARDAFGAEAIGLTKVPSHRDDKGLYGHVCQEPNSLYVASFSSNQDAALEWIGHVASVEELNELVKLTQEQPADDRWDTSLITDEQIRLVFKGASEKNTVYPYTYTNQLQYESLLANGILFLTGDMSAEELLAGFDQAKQEWNEQQA